MRRAVAGVGRVLITVGLLTLLFVGYQLWGTNVLQARAQGELSDQFEELRRTHADRTDDDPVVGDDGSREPAAASPAVVPAFAPGDPMGRIVIPRIGVDEVFVAGVSRDNLRLGPGHYPGTPLPGQAGNAAIAGHRTTYGAPFFDLGDLAVDDWIVTETLLGTHLYVVEWLEVVRPTDVHVVAPVAEDPDGAYLTLTTCHPKYSARERLVVRARLVEPDEHSDRDRPADGARAVDAVEIEGGGTTLADLPEWEAERAADLDEGFAGDPASRAPTAAWGAVAGLVGLLWWWAFRRWRHPLTWVGGGLPFLVAVGVAFVHLERMLPAGY